MSEIDFAEIEKAMAELVNKAQGKERQQGLKQVAKERSQAAKEIETAHEQGDIATKRIVTATSTIRSNPHPAHAKPTAPIMPASPGRVMDFVPPTPAPTPSVEDLSPEQEDLQKTVGELSNEYLVEQVVSPDVPEVEASSIDFGAESAEEIVADIEDELGDSKETSATEGAHATKLEDLTGPSPVMSAIQEPTMSSVSQPQDEAEDQLPEANELAEEVGKVHKIYGQKLPKEYLKKKDKDFSAKPTKTKVQEPRRGRGFAFYFIFIMIIAAVAVWAGAAYLYFIY